jgi:hypothetical protein
MVEENKVKGFHEQKAKGFFMTNGRDVGRVDKDTDCKGLSLGTWSDHGRDECDVARRPIDGESDAEHVPLLMVPDIWQSVWIADRHTNDDHIESSILAIYNNSLKCVAVHDESHGRRGKVVDQDTL